MSLYSPPVSAYAFPRTPQEYAPAPLPSLAEWSTLWAAWDMITTQMVPASALQQKPIPLRNPLLFYLGHIPTFEDIHLARATREPRTPPALYADIFERGIDPDVDDPSKCHPHSQLPDVLPDLAEILEYRQHVCTRIRRLYAEDRATGNRCIARALWIGYEHECLHLETFLFMTLLSADVRPPPGPHPDFERLAQRSAAERVPNQWIRVPDQTMTIGFEDPESDSGPDRWFAWDNEREPYQIRVPTFEAKARPVTNGEYALYLLRTALKEIPMTWVRDKESDGPQMAPELDLDSFFKKVSVRTVYGPVPLQWAQDWPLMASYNEVAAYAAWVGGRVPTLHEVRAIHAHAEHCQRSEKGAKPGTHGILNPDDIFADLTGCNVGMQHFHPMPVTQNGGRLSGLGDMGGAWEWTSSLFAPQPGFKPMDIYPGYSADFMDGKHMAVVGGSWALPPRIAGRKSFLNWWQPNYLYPWVASRLVRDAACGQRGGEAAEVVPVPLTTPR